MLQLETDRLLLRAPVPDDADALAPMYADPEVMRFVGDGRTLTHGDTERSVKRMIERWEADGFGLFTTVRKEDGAVIGRPYWGQGYATEAAGAVRDYALVELGAERLIALIIHGNTASENVARKLGLAYERNIMLGRREAQLFALDA